DLQEAPAIWEPRDNRVGFFEFNLAGVGRKILRAVHLQGYSFYLAFFSPIQRSADEAISREAILSTMPGIALLSASRQTVSLASNGIDAWQSFRDARDNSYKAS